MARELCTKLEDGDLGKFPSTSILL